MRTPQKKIAWNTWKLYVYGRRVNPVQETQLGLAGSPNLLRRMNFPE